MVVSLCIVLRMSSPSIVWGRPKGSGGTLPLFITVLTHTAEGRILCKGYFPGENFGGGKFRHPCKCQSLHCLTQTLHCPKTPISPGKNFATLFKDENVP